MMDGEREGRGGRERERLDWGREREMMGWDGVEVEVEVGEMRVGDVGC